MTYALSPADIIQCRAINMRYSARVREIALAISAETSIPISSIYGRRRTRPIVEARWLVMYLASEAGISQVEIGKALNLKDHTSVSHGIRSEKKRRGELPGIAQ